MKIRVLKSCQCAGRLLERGDEIDTVSMPVYAEIAPQLVAEGFAEESQPEPFPEPDAKPKAKP